MILSDHEIFNQVVNHHDIRNSGHDSLDIRPWNPDQLQPASYELTLDSRFMVFDPFTDLLDPLHESSPKMTEVDVAETDVQHFVLYPGELALCSSIERLYFPADIVGLLNGKSSLGRLGLQIHTTSGFFDPGFNGTATLEISNVSRFAIRLHPGMTIAQMVFMKMSQPTNRPYGSRGLGSRYQYQSGPTPMRVQKA